MNLMIWRTIFPMISTCEIADPDDLTLEIESTKYTQKSSLSLQSAHAEMRGESSPYHEGHKQNNIANDTHDRTSCRKTRQLIIKNLWYKDTVTT